jgi:hypothetical protein
MQDPKPRLALVAAVLFLHHIYIPLDVPTRDPIMLQYCVAALVLLLPVPSHFLFLAALVESLSFCSANCSLACFRLVYFYSLVESSPLSCLATRKH